MFQEINLLQNNYKHGTKPAQPLGSTVTFHAGVIGSGARPQASDALVTSDQAEVNKRLVAGVIQRLCEAGGPGGEGAKQLALMLVEVISPNIMYNGFPWYDVDFMRHQVIWSLLYQLAVPRPALCYCSVLVRAVLAVQFSHWQSHTTSSLANHPEQTKNRIHDVHVAKEQMYPLKLKGISICFSMLKAALFGSYVNFGVFSRIT